MLAASAVHQHHVLTAADCNNLNDSSCVEQDEPLRLLDEHSLWRRHLGDTSILGKVGWHALHARSRTIRGRDFGQMTTLQLLATAVFHFARWHTMPRVCEQTHDITTWHALCV